MTQALTAHAQVGDEAAQTSLSIAGLVAAFKRWVCPECLLEKHQNCDGLGGFDEDDQPVPCSCWAEGHQL